MKPARQKERRNAGKTAAKAPARTTAPPRLKVSLSALLGRFGRRQAAGQNPVVPPQTIAGHALTLVIAIMTFLASLTLGAVTLVEDAADAWLSDIGREVTIEVRAVAGADPIAEIAKAVELARGFPGVGAARALSDEETRRLLEPWLGAGVDLDALPVPRLVVVTVADAAVFDVAALKSRVASDIRGGAVDDHNAWIDRLRAMSTSMVVIGVAVLALVLVAMVLSVVFATRAAMAGNRHVIEVLHFCGAADSFIAGEFQRHFLWLGVRGGVIGGGLAALSFAVLSLLFRESSGLPGTDQIDTLLGGVRIGPLAYGGVALLVVGVAALTAFTSRLAVRRSLAGLE